MSGALAVVPESATPSSASDKMSLTQIVDDVVAAIKRGDQTSETGDVYPFVSLRKCPQIFDGTAEMLAEYPYIEFAYFGGFPSRPRRIVNVSKLGIPKERRAEFKKLLAERLSALSEVSTRFGGTDTQLTVDMRWFVTDWNKKQIEKKEQEFASLVEELRGCKMRGEEAMTRAVAIIDEYREKFGKSKAKLAVLAEAVGVDVRTLYRWRNLVKNPTPKKTVAKAKQSLTPEQIATRLLKKITDDATLREVIGILTRELFDRAAVNGERA